MRRDATFIGVEVDDGAAADAALAARLAELRTCSGAECRRLEDLVPLEDASPELAAQPQ
jgi:hypothetical protein